MLVRMLACRVCVMRDPAQLGHAALCGMVTQADVSCMLCCTIKGLIVLAQGSWTGKGAAPRGAAPTSESPPPVGRRGTACTQTRCLQTLDAGIQLLRIVIRQLATSCKAYRRLAMHMWPAEPMALTDLDNLDGKLRFSKVRWGICVAPFSHMLLQAQQGFVPAAA